ncbi:MAG: hypothetical protein ACLP2Y_05915, partial [Limisphaerales bacterium]
AFRARADPLAGTDFARRVVIILRQVLVEITLGIAQIFLRNGGKHKALFYLFFKRLCSFSEQSSISFICRFAILSAGEPAKMCQTRKMRSQMFASGGQWNQKYEHGFIHAVI